LERKTLSHLRWGTNRRYIPVKKKRHDYQTNGKRGQLGGKGSAHEEAGLFLHRGDALAVISQAEKGLRKGTTSQGGEQAAFEGAIGPLYLEVSFLREGEGGRTLTGKGAGGFGGGSGALTEGKNRQAS